MTKQNVLYPYNRIISLTSSSKIHWNGSQTSGKALYVPLPCYYKECESRTVEWKRCTGKVWRKGPTELPRPLGDPPRTSLCSVWKLTPPCCPRTPQTSISSSPTSLEVEGWERKLPLSNHVVFLVTSPILKTSSGPTLSPHQHKYRADQKGLIMNNKSC